MTAHLLAISIGPVQDFIAAARRTRDLWFGSHVLSEISRAAATAVKDKGGELVVPTKEDAATDDAAVPNVILAETEDPRAVAHAARGAATERWLEFADEAHRAAGPLIREHLWREQLDDVIEFYAAWVPLDDDYKGARRRVVRVLAGRKACRDFLPGKGHAGIPKSSLDGRRESVLQKGVAAPANLLLAKGEQLCAVGLTKRLAGGRQPYPSVARIAADPWLRQLVHKAERDEKVRAAFNGLRDACEKLAGREAIHRLDTRRFPQFEAFPYEGTSVFTNRFHEWSQEAGLSEDELRPLREQLGILKELNLGEPDPYLAVLVGDGDRMGEVISNLDRAERHRDLSHSLARFAASAQGIVARKNGACVYAGGDDVLAFVPVDKALGCARTLHQEFSAALSDFTELGWPPTLSVGIAVGHFMEPLEDLREYGRQAEKAAKRKTPDTDGTGAFGERNGLAVRIYPRSGVEYGVREQWQDGGESLDKRLQGWARLFAARRLPNKLPYNLRELTTELGTWAPPAAVRADVKLLLKRKQVQKDVREKLERRLATVTTPGALSRWAEEMLVAQWLGGQDPGAAVDLEK